MSEREGPFDARPHGLDWRTEDAIRRNALSMKPREYAWLKTQDFQPPIRRALVAEYERIHEGPRP